MNEDAKDGLYKKQTAVEWLIDELSKFEKGESEYFSTTIIKNKAIRMEKQQKMKCWETAHQAGRFEGKGIAEENWQTFEQYYNEEYGK